MKRPSISLYIFSIALMLGTSSAVYSAEKLIYHVPKNWFLAFHDGNASQQLREYIPRGQIIDDWKQLLSVNMTKLPRKIAPADYLAAMGQIAKTHCPNQVQGKIYAGVENGYQVAIKTEFCPFYTQSQKGEITAYKAILGDNTIYVVHWAFRTKPFDLNHIPINRKEWERAKQYIAKEVYLCNTRVAGSCPK